MTVRSANLGVILICIMAGQSLASEPWIKQESGTSARLRGVCVVSPTVVWASGTQGTVLRTTDGGASWQVRRVPGAEKRDFRDVEAFDARSAFVLSIGPGEQSRIYQTQDAGASWKLRYTNSDPRWFLDAIAFWDAQHGIALGDPADGRFVILVTEDGGKTWSRPPATRMPPALEGEGAFAASGTCLVVHGDRYAWFGTGGARTSRVFRSTDRGQSWTAHEAPIGAGKPTRGIFSLAFRDAEHGGAVGGDYQQLDSADSVVATTRDGGITWQVPRDSHPAGYRSAVAFVPSANVPSLVAVGPSGSDFSANEGQTWRPLGSLGFHAVGFAPGSATGWAVGEDGLVAKLERTPSPP